MTFARGHRLRRALRVLSVLAAGSLAVCGVRGSPRPPLPEEPDAGAGAAAGGPADAAFGMGDLAEPVYRAEPAEPAPAGKVDAALDGGAP